MKKQFLILIIAHAASSLSGQVGIGTENFTVSEAVHVESKNRGILFPRFYMPDPLNDISPAINPKPYMLAFNNDPEYMNENSFYYSYNKTAEKMAWRGVLDVNIINSRLIPMKSFISMGQGDAYQTTALGGAVGYTIGESPTDHPWVEIPGMRKVINFNSNKNETTILVEGMVQDNNTGGYTTSNSFAIGLFVDGKLWTTRTFIVDSGYNRPCSYQIFNLKSNIYNLIKGNHTFSVYAITRNKLSGDATELSFGSANNKCSNISLNTMMAGGDLSIQIQEFK
ncbi:hypothetical protein EDL99_03775 [Ornithobacterium rhinotracheale]|uniref:hypothetical protein n=1 Tax=Ornithobacterium rhinotracheale TaxID=28251 RepID=UPI00129C8171|nr:hypothetical protein [Ornithobacterium rhinotracheale]MRJ08008.1 hypothetical protein [Ornithobacterium rhinotracheale]UOH78484.1 hypothetical protein MT996_03215 [Ornithobacterium rhinotracheale]